MPSGAHTAGLCQETRPGKGRNPHRANPVWRAQQVARVLVPKAALVVLLSGSGCSNAAPTSPARPEARVSVSGQISDRLVGSPVGGSIIFFRGSSISSTAVSADGRYEVHNLVPGDYEVSILGDNHVRHETRRMTVLDSAELRFTVIKSGLTLFGVTLDQTFNEFFHQLARGGQGAGALRKWVVRPAELYVVEGTVPADQFRVVVMELEEVNQRVVPALWCNWIGPMRVTTGPLPSTEVEGRIVVTPNWDGGASGSVGPTEITSGRVAINVFRPNDKRLNTSTEIRGILAHELFHVAGAFHTCGGSLGDNPFGFGPSNCPYPSSLMANLGPLVEMPSPEDRLASCLMYANETVPGNRYPDINPYYPGR